LNGSIALTSFVWDDGTLQGREPCCCIWMKGQRKARG
jgi:hypothetical protein